MNFGISAVWRKFNQIICSFMICLPVFCYGTCVGWMSPMGLLLQSENSPRGEPLPDYEISWMASIAYLTSVPFYYLFAYMGDRFGRKITLIFSASSGVIIWTLKLCSTNFWVLLTARGILGILMAGSFVTGPVYIKEISDNSVRGFLGCLTTLFLTAGNLTSFIIGDMLSYRTIIVVCLIMSVFGVLMCISLPESPSYLVQTGRIEEAEKVLAWLRKKPKGNSEIKEELDVIKLEQKKDISEESLLKTVFTDKILFQAFRIALMTSLTREICGVVAVMNFAGNIFQEAGNELVLNANQQAMMLGAVQCLGSIVASSIVEKSGRRPLLYTTSIISGLSICVLATWFQLKDLHILAPSWIPVLTLCICIFCDCAGLLPLSLVITGELFSFKYRGTVLATTMTIASVFDFFQVLFFKPLVAALGVQGPFYCFGVICLIAAGYFILWLPETKSRPLDEIYDDLRPKGKPQNDVYKL